MFTMFPVCYSFVASGTSLSIKGLDYPIVSDIDKTRYSVLLLSTFKIKSSIYGINNETKYKDLDLSFKT
jgi:hypothetical protein